MSEITKEWMASLSKRDLDRALSLGMYHYRAQLLFIHTDEWAQVIFSDDRPQKDKEEAYSSFFVHYYMMWTSMVYVVHEGFVELGIEDSKLEAARAKVDLPLLRRFRNGTFHYQPNVFSAKHDEFIGKHGFGAARDMHERHGVLTRRMGRFVKYNPVRDLMLDRPGMPTKP